MSIEIAKAKFGEFFKAPFACYGRDTHFISPLRSDLRRALDAQRNPLFRDFARRELFVARRGGKLVGRILAHVHDASNRLHGLKRGYFGLFDCIDDADVAGRLLDSAAQWVKERGCDELAGSFNLSITQIIGIVTGGFERAAYTYQEYSPPHIARLLEQSGFEAFFPMSTYELEVRQFDPQQLLGEREQRLLIDPHWRFEAIRRRGFEQRLLEACAVLNDGFADNALFVPLGEQEFLFPCDGMMWIIDEHLCYTAYHDDEPVGVLLCVPDLGPFLRATDFRLKWSTPWHLLKFRLDRSRAAIIFFAVRRSYHGRGINAIMLHHTIDAMRRRGYSHLGISWVSDSNGASRRQMQKIGAQPLHKLNLYRKAL